MLIKAEKERLGEMGDSKREEDEAQVEIWKYAFGFTEMAVVKCAIELGIADVLARQEEVEGGAGGGMTLEGLSSSLGCSPSSLYRIMRFLTHRGIFKQVGGGGSGSNDNITFAQTPLSRLLVRKGENSMAALVLFESTPVMLAPWHGLRDSVLGKGGAAPFDAAHGQDVWKYAQKNPEHSKLLNEAMSCNARLVVSTILETWPEVFEGIGSLVDVGGGDGTALRTLLKARPRMRGINFDLPHVVSVAPEFDGVEHVGGNFFESVPKADAALIMWVLHDWGDEECIRILKNCREAVAANTGKVIILEAVIEEEGGGGGAAAAAAEEEKKLKDVGLMLDMIMMAHTSRGKERTAKEWGYVVGEAGFRGHSIKRIKAVQSIIEAYA